MSKKISRIIGAIMLIAAIAFVGYALNHPEGSWPWPGSVTQILYLVYLIVTFLFLGAPFDKKS